MLHDSCQPEVERHLPSLGAEPAYLPPVAARCDDTAARVAPVPAGPRATPAPQLSPADVEARLPAGGRDEAELLAALAEVLREALAAPAASVVRLGGAGAGQLAPEVRLRELVNDVAEARTIGGEQRAAWATLAPWRQTVRARLGRAPQAITLFPVRGDGEPLAGVALGWAAAPPEGQQPARWHEAALLCAWAGERIALLRARATAGAFEHAQDSFMSLAAHELRSPLTSVKGYAQLLQRQARRGGVPEGVARSAAAVAEQAERLSEMIDELHDAARLRRGQLELLLTDMDLVPLVSDVVERLRPNAPRHEIRLEVGAAPLVGHWDAHRLGQVVRDLCGNAVRFSPSGGVVEVRLAREGRRAVMWVRDEGIGVAEAEQARIFDYLYRSPAAEARNLTGLGLGLYVGRAHAERMGGSLRLVASRTEAPSGSAFELALPLAAG